MTASSGPRPHHVRVTTGSRLHLGLLGFEGPDGVDDQAFPGRRFGSVGLMIERPRTQIEVGSSHLKPNGSPLAIECGHDFETRDRIISAWDRAGRMLGPTGLGEAWPGEVSVTIDVRAHPRRHAGLGSGTQLALAVGSARAPSVMDEVSTDPDRTATLLARLTGRGRRSGVGLHGFTRGGLILDSGHPGTIPTASSVREISVPTLLVRSEFPVAWPILVVLPRADPGTSGTAEVRAFRELGPMANRRTDRICRAVLLGLLPAIRERDFPAFLAAQEMIQREVGEAFAPVQGGTIRPELAPLAGAMHDLGLSGIGQSSWGPGLYGFAGEEDPERQAHVLAGLWGRYRLRPGIDAFWTRARNRPAEIDVGIRPDFPNFEVGA